jgi:RNA polymerase sigma factor (sigma-70 family)
VVGRLPARQPASTFDDTMRAAQSGAPSACREIYETYARRVCAYLAAHSAPDPEDLTSEVFLRVFDGLLRFRGDEAQFRAWLFTISHHVLVDDVRRRRVRPQSAQFVPGAHEIIAGGDAEDDALDQLGDTWVHDRLALLPPDQRNVLTLRIFADLTVDQIANVLDKPRGAVKALQRRGLAALRRALEGVTHEVA